MSVTLDRLDFYPPRAQGTGRALAFALAAHLALVAALTWGVSWKRESASSAVEAEIWSALPQQAAPKAVEAPPPTVASPAPEPAPPKAPEIAVEKERPKTTPKPANKPEAKPEPKPNKAAEEKLQAKQNEQERQKQMDRVARMAQAGGTPDTAGSANQSSGPSGSYAGLIRGRVKPNLVFAGSVSGNPVVSLEIRLAPDGTILGRPRILKSSGSKEWDEAVVRAFEKTEVLPRDAGKIWSPLLIDWRFND